MPIRPATQDDAEAIAAIYAHYVATSVATFDEDAPPHESFAAKIEDIQRAGLPYVVSESGGRVDGYAYLGPYRDRSAYRFTVECSVYVAAGARGRGLGRALLERLLEDGRAAGMREVIAVISDAGDPASVGLHRALGFADAGRLTKVGFKHDRWIDVLFLQRSLV